MSRPATNPSEVAKLLKAAKDRDRKVPWRIVEAETGILKTTREGWFKAGPPEPPLGPVCYLATHLGVDPSDLVAAALADYQRPTAGPPEAEPSDEGVAGDVADAARVLPARQRERKPSEPARRSRKSSRPAPEG